MSKRQHMCGKTMPPRLRGKTALPPEVHAAVRHAFLFHSPRLCKSLINSRSPDPELDDRVTRLGGPISLQAALVFISSLVSLAFAGHLGKLSLSQAVLALSAYNITGVSLLLGLASGMETLCSQVARFAASHAFCTSQAYCNVLAWVAQALSSPD